MDSETTPILFAVLGTIATIVTTLITAGATKKVIEYRMTEFEKDHKEHREETGEMKRTLTQHSIDIATLKEKTNHIKP